LDASSSGKREWDDVCAKGALEKRIREDLLFGIDEFAEVLLTEGPVAEGEAFLIEEGWGDAGAFGGGDGDAGPMRAAAGPFVMEEAALAVRG